MLKYDIIVDASKLLNVQPKVVSNFVDVLTDCMCSAILDAKARSEDVITLNLGLSSVSIDLVNNQWKSIPSKETKLKISESLKSSAVDPVTEELVALVKSKLLKAIEEVKSDGR